MSWSSFSYSYMCRLISSMKGEEGEPCDLVDAAFSDKGLSLYGKAVCEGDLAYAVLERFKSLESKKDLLNIALIYKEVDFSDLSDVPLKFKRVFVYLCYVVFVFVFVSLLYQSKIYPTFLGVYEEFGVDLRQNSEFLEVGWFSVYPFVILFLGLCLCSLYAINKLFVFKNNFDESIAFKFFLFPKARRSYSNIIDILTFLVKSDLGDERISNHLGFVLNSELKTSEEINSILKIEAKELINSCERQVKIMYSVISVFIIINVMSFLTSAYSPIFMIGGAV